MDLSRPYSAICPSLDGEVLHVLAGTEMGLTGRSIATLTGRRSHAGVLRVLDRLTEQGIVNRVELNFASLYSLNREHLAFPAVEAMMGLRDALSEAIKRKVAVWRIEPVSVSMFGSAARGDGDTRSDIDLLVVRPDEMPEEDARWRAQLTCLEADIFDWTGNRASVLDRSVAELARLQAERRPIIEELLSQALTLHGVAISALLDEL
jgi:predicted nucleotidyltransferase